jgi:hypothetical protein
MPSSRDRILRSEKPADRKIARAPDDPATSDPASADPKPTGGKRKASETTKNDTGSGSKKPPRKSRPQIYGPRQEYILENSTLRLPEDRLIGQHLPEKGRRRGCWLCRLKWKRANRASLCAGGEELKNPDVRTVNRCETCDKNLCYDSQRNCWAEFHRA